MPMQKRRGTDLLMHLDRSVSGDGLTRQIYTQLRAAILDGRLRAGDRLPPSRDRCLLSFSRGRCLYLSLLRRVLPTSLRPFR